MRKENDRIHPSPKYISDLMGTWQSSWGLRGDPYLWDELKDKLAERSLPRRESELWNVLEVAFAELTGAELITKREIFVARYDNGGMSSGLVSVAFYREEVFPEIVLRFSKLSSDQLL